MTPNEAKTKLGEPPTIQDFEVRGKCPSSLYLYKSKEGRPIGAVVRFDAGTLGKKKQFFQYRRKPDHSSANAVGYVPGLGSGDQKVALPLYRLPELLEAVQENQEQSIYFVEGEKCVEALVFRGLVATCIPGGSNAKTDAATLEQLEGCKVNIIQDCDQAGREFGKRVANMLSGVADQVKIIDLNPNRNDGYDIADWLAEGHPTAGIDAIVNATPVETVVRSNASGSIPQPVLVNMADVEPEEVDWLWFLRIARGAISMIVGDPGLGKSFLTQYIAAQVTNGGKFPDCDKPVPEGSVILLDAENGLSNTIRPRLEAAGANLPKVQVFKSIRRQTKHGAQERPVSLDADLEVLDTALEQTPGVVVVIVDPVSAYLPNIDSNSNTDVRSVLARLQALAEKHNVAMILVSHTNKGQGRAIHRVIGSSGFAGAARSVWCVDRDQNDKDKRLLLPIKNNIGNDQTGLAFRIQDDTVHWYDEVVYKTASESLSGQSGEVNTSARDEAQEWLRELLLQGDIAATKVFNEAKEAGFSRRTVERAKADLGARSVKNREAWLWRLPNAASDTPTPEDGGVGGLKKTLDIDPRDMPDGEEESSQYE